MKKGKTTSNYAKGKKEILEQRKVQMKVFVCLYRFKEKHQ